MECNICNNKINYVFSEVILNKYNIKYYQCKQCGFLQTEKPYWLQEAYKSAIAKQDLTVVERAYKNTIILNQILKKILKPKSKILDFGAGYGILCRLMRNLGYDFYWYDKYANNVFSYCFEYSNQPIDLITCFEVFEHFENPLQEIEKLLSICNEIIFTTDSYDDYFSIPDKNWSYYTFATGQHISFYSEQTLKYIADTHNLHYIKINKCWHMFTKNKANESKLSFLKDITKDFDRYNREFILNNNKQPILKDMEIISKQLKN